jgi:hypothetical protein
MAYRLDRPSCSCSRSYVTCCSAIVLSKSFLHPAVVVPGSPFHFHPTVVRSSPLHVRTAVVAYVQTQLPVTLELYARTAGYDFRIEAYTVLLLLPPPPPSMRSVQVQ